MDERLMKGGIPVLAGEYLLKVTKDKIHAVLQPRIEGSGCPGNLEEVKRELAACGIVHGIVDHLIPGQGGVCVVARGLGARDGTHGTVKFHVNPPSPEALRPKGGGSDHHVVKEMAKVVNVEPDTLLFEKVPPTQGIPGKDVFGNDIPAKPGKDITLKPGTGVVFSDNGLQAHATIAGKFVMTEGRPAILEEHTVQGDMDFKVGDVIFFGKKLTIDGEIFSGVKIECRGDVTVTKGMDNAVITAGGTVSVKGGIIGPESHIKAGGDISIDFAESGPLFETEQSMNITDVIIQCRVKAGKDVRAIKGKGIIHGGEFVVGGSVYAKEIGSEAEIGTSITVGLKPEIEERRRKLVEDQEIWPNKMNEVLKNITGLRKMKKEAGNKLSPDKEQLLQKLSGLLPKLMMQVNDLTRREEEISNELEKAAAEAVYVGGPIYSNVTIRIGKACRTTSRIEEGVVARLEKSNLQIHFHSMSAEERTLFSI